MLSYPFFPFFPHVREYIWVNSYILPFFFFALARGKTLWLLIESERTKDMGKGQEIEIVDRKSVV